MVEVSTSILSVKKGEESKTFFALEKAKILGLSKATRTLQNEMPSIFGDLSPSTLQYWIQKEREKIKN